MKSKPQTFYMQPPLSYRGQWLLLLYAPTIATLLNLFSFKKLFFLILSHDGNVLNGICSFRTNISPYIKTLDQKRTPFSSGHAVETVFVQIPAENAPHVARALSSRIQERQNAFQIIWTWLLFRDAFRGQNANFIRTGTILYI